METIDVIVAEYQAALKSYESLRAHGEGEYGDLFAAWLDVAAKAELARCPIPKRPGDEQKVELENDPESSDAIIDGEVRQEVIEALGVAATISSDNESKVTSEAPYRSETRTGSTIRSDAPIDSFRAYTIIDPPPMQPNFLPAARAAEIVKNNPVIVDDSAIPKNQKPGVNYESLLVRLIQGELLPEDVPAPTSAADVRSLKKLLGALADEPNTNKDDAFLAMFHGLTAKLPRSGHD